MGRTLRSALRNDGNDIGKFFGLNAGLVLCCYTAFARRNATMIRQRGSVIRRQRRQQATDSRDGGGEEVADGDEVGDGNGDGQRR